ncbi:MAG: GGDEF domain-containing protein [Thermoleophilia bacterium]|nr:GGDEF domain-containing protein [Thermoleophilia bacterium]
MGQTEPAARGRLLGPAPIEKTGLRHDPSLRPVFVLMVAFGILLGILLPLGVQPFVEWRPGAEAFFRTLSLLGGLCVGLLAFFVVRITLYETTKRLATAATVDSLTGLQNHRSFLQQLAAECSKSSRYARPLSLAIIDIDHFKQVNDTHGHQTGDAVLCEVAALVRRQIRASDTACRIGGEEIALILPDTDPEQALTVCERLRTAMAEHTFPVVGRMTVSAGIAGYPADTGDEAELVHLADVAMYSAKQAGRNLTRLWDHAASVIETS